MLGASPIYLLGFDCKGADARGLMANFHDEYPEGWSKPEAYLQEKWLRAFRKHAPDIRGEVINLGPDSAIDCFPKKDWKEVLL